LSLFNPALAETGDESEKRIRAKVSVASVSDFRSSEFFIVSIFLQRLSVFEGIELLGHSSQSGK
jgi:hypothetical protein